MNDEASFLQAMQENPEDNALRLVFADWLEERGDRRGELIRLLHTLTQTVEVPDRGKLEDRLRGLLASGVQPVGPFWTNSIGMKFAWIPAGTFLMGSPESEKDREEQETRHKVTLSKGIYLTIHPVSQSSWREVMSEYPGDDHPRANPSYDQGEDLPVDEVSWDDCQEFLRELSDREGHVYRLPTEAEWEYACRAGTTTPYYLGDTITTDQANYNGNFHYGRPKRRNTREREGLYRGKVTPLGSFPPNAWGLHDMHGNVLEWCVDRFGDYPQGDVVDPQGPESGYSRVFRGGCFQYSVSNVRSADRGDSVPSQAYAGVGFRAVRTFP